MLRTRLRECIAQVGHALQEPDAFAVRWDCDEVHDPVWVWAALGMTAILGTTTHGMTMGILGGTAAVLAKGLIRTAAAGLAFLVALPEFCAAVFVSRLALAGSTCASLPELASR